jgi:hypothetical protein
MYHRLRDYKQIVSFFIRASGVRRKAQLVASVAQAEREMERIALNSRV